MVLESLFAVALAGGWETHGPELPNVTVVVTSAADDRRVYALANDSSQAAIFRSDDAGQTWRKVFEAPPDEFLSTPLEVDPSNPDRLFAATFQVIPSIPFSHSATRLYRSVDGADTWTVQLGVGDAALCSMAFGQPGAVYVACRGRQPLFFRSEDGGDSFDGGWATFFGLGVPILATTPDEVLLSTSGWQSRDGGRTWQPWIDIPLNCALTSLAIDPSNSNRMFVSGGSTQTFCGEVLRSMDGGVTWSRTTDVGGPVLDLVMDPSDPSLIYVSTAPVGRPGRVLVSDDEGDSWRDLGFPASASAKDLAITGNGERIYAATTTGVYTRSLLRTRVISPRP